MLGVDGVPFRFEGASRSKQTLGQCTIQECGRIRRQRNLWISDNLPGEIVCARDSEYMMRLVVPYSKAENAQNMALYSTANFHRQEPYSLRSNLRVKN